MHYTTRPAVTALCLPLFAALLLQATPTGSAQAPPAARPQGPDRSIVPAALRDALLDEISGEQALAHVQLLAVNRDRQPQEYLETYVYSEEYRTRAEGLPKLVADLPEPRLSGLAATEAVRFIDGRRARSTSTGSYAPSTARSRRTATSSRSHTS